MQVIIEMESLRKVASGCDGDRGLGLLLLDVNDRAHPSVIVLWLLGIASDS